MAYPKAKRYAMMIRRKLKLQGDLEAVVAEIAEVDEEIATLDMSREDVEQGLAKIKDEIDILEGFGAEA